jgi:excisionase family DNA binding protein
VHEEPVEQSAQQPGMETPEKNAGLPQSEAVESEISAVRPVEQPSTEELSASRARRVWEELPMHTKLLLGPEKKEVTQNSYQEFKETRQELIQRLLDPSLSLEEVARILNVCPTTVRRYTNRQLLPHFRTAGNQRRFRLSDVLAFLESNYRGMPEA